MKVHPDRFVQHPDARRANEASFKALQSYLEELRGHGDGMVPQLYDLEFYAYPEAQATVASSSDSRDKASLQFSEAPLGRIDPNIPSTGAPRRILPESVAYAEAEAAFKHQMDARNRDSTGRCCVLRSTINQANFRKDGLQDSDEVEPSLDNNGTAQMESEKLRCIRIRLPPPVPGSADKLPGRIRHALGRLFRAFDLDNVFVAASQPAHSSVEEGVLIGHRLQPFLQDATELIRQGEAVQHGLPAQQVSAIRSALWLGRRLRVTFDADAELLSAVAHVSLLEALAGALDTAADADVSALTIIIGAGHGVDAFGRVWLPIGEDEVTWANTLQRLDFGRVRERRSHLESVQRSENIVAKMIGVDTLFAGQRLMLSAIYEEFLKKLALSAEQTGPIRGGQLKGVNLCACAPAEVPDLQVSLDTCVIKASTDVEPLSLFDYVGYHGPILMQKWEKRAATEDELSRLTRQVERCLRLRRLLRDPELSADNYKSGCYRMLRFQQPLFQLLEGSSVRLSTTNAMQPGSAVVDVAWNFEW